MTKIRYAKNVMMDVCLRNNSCADCDDESCLNRGRIFHGCPKRSEYCDGEMCETCEYLPDYIRKVLREEHDG